jgi:hypothetical protein
VQQKKKKKKKEKGFGYKADKRLSPFDSNLHAQ